jgi:hypothetical protein
MARGRDDFADAYVDAKIGISEYPLSASVACGKVRFFSRCQPVAGSMKFYYSLPNHFTDNPACVLFSSAAPSKSSGTSSERACSLRVDVADLLSWFDFDLLLNFFVPVTFIPTL